MTRSSIFRYLLLPTLAGLLATWLVYRYVAPPSQAAQLATVEVVVAERALPPRTVLARADLALQPFPKDYLPTGAVTSLEDALGRVTVAPLAAGEIVLAAHLAEPTSKVALAYHVPAGFRAFTIPIGETTAVAGFIQPGDRVDLVFVRSGGSAAGGAQGDQATLLVQNVQVLAVGQRQDSDPQAAEGQLQGYTSLTVALTARDAVRVALALEVGKVRVALRPAAPEGTVNVGVVDDGDLTQP
ncbi:MAG: Flp pilus assembly protein CpaB [Clostridia bacterium]|nr:Flp pilus assembly protein CpaB [Clostridia bacterium]